MQEQFPQDNLSRIREVFSAKERVQLRSLRGLPYVLFMFRKRVRKDWPFYAGLVVLLIRWIVVGHLARIEIALGAAILAYFIWLAVCFFLPGPAEHHDALLEAVAWGRWNNVLEILKDQELRLQLIPPFELAIRKAQAFAGLGQLDSAIDCLRPFERAPNIPAWMYQAALAEIYSVARADHKAIESLEAASQFGSA